MTLPLRALLLDFAGTLVTEVPGRAAIYAEAAARAGLALEEADMGRRMGAAHDALPVEIDGAYRYTRPWFERFIEVIFADGLGVSRAGLDGIRAELFARFADARTYRVFPGARELLAEARAAKVGTAIVSNWSDGLVTLASELALDADVVLSSADLRSEKPDTALFEAALTALGADPSEALHVGDTHDKDVIGARAAGIRAWLVVRGSEPAPAGVRAVDGLNAVRRDLAQWPGSER